MFPIVLMGTEYWRPLVEFLEGTLARRGTIDQADLSCFRLTDSIDELRAVIEASIVQNAPSWGKRPRPRRILGERERVAGPESAG
jgi:predicted Rossmann-fold nucleotide-binding protein